MLYVYVLYRGYGFGVNLFYIDCINFGVITQKDVEKNSRKKSKTDLKKKKKKDKDENKIMNLSKENWN